MPDIPAEAVQAAALAMATVYLGYMPEVPREVDEDAARAALEAASPAWIAQERADERRKVAEQIAAEIKEVIGSYPDNEAIRPRYERGGFLNDSQWAAQIARQIGEAP